MVDQCTRQYTQSIECLRKPQVGNKTGCTLTRTQQEICLQNEEVLTPTTMSHQNINRALHAMAAHLHRYTSELK